MARDRGFQSTRQTLVRGMLVGAAWRVTALGDSQTYLATESPPLLPPVSLLSLRLYETTWGITAYQRTSK